MFKFYNIVLLFDFSRNAFSHLTHSILGLVQGRNQTEEINVPKGKKKKKPNINQQTKSLSHQLKKKTQYITTIVKHKTSYENKFWLCKTTSIQASGEGRKQLREKKY